MEKATKYKIYRNIRTWNDGEEFAYTSYEEWLLRFFGEEAFDEHLKKKNIAKTEIIKSVVKSYEDKLNKEEMGKLIEIVSDKL